MDNEFIASLNLDEPTEFSSIPLMDLLFDVRDDSFYMYSGSLTEPDCLQGVTNVVVSGF